MTEHRNRGGFGEKDFLLYFDPNFEIETEVRRRELISRSGVWRTGSYAS